MKTFRARLAFGMAASALTILLLSGASVYFGVEATLQEQQDEALQEITRTEIEGPSNVEDMDPAEVSASDESLLVWERETATLCLERGKVPLRAWKRTVDRAEFARLNIAGHAYRALYYPFVRERTRYMALCVEPSAPLSSALNRIALRLLLIGVLGAGAACLIAWRLAARLTHPLEKIAQRTACIREGDLQQRLPRYSDDAELVAVTDGLNAMLGRLESAFAAQGRFVTDAAHELRSPLANLRTTAEVALRRPDAGTRERALRITVTEIERLTRLTESLLTLSLADAGTLVQEHVLVDLGAIATEAIEAIRARADAIGLSLILQTEPASVYGDALRLRQVFDNLLDNAVRHSPDGGAVAVVLEKREGCIRVSVTDDGAGISEVDRRLVFDRLWRADTARARATGGFGLGLSIVQAIVQAHGGTIDVENIPPHGSRFSFRLSHLTSGQICSLVRRKEPGGGIQNMRSPLFQEEAILEAYCMKCKQKREMKNPQPVTMKNGKSATTGECGTCGTKLFKIGKAG